MCRRTTKRSGVILGYENYRESNEENQNRIIGFAGACAPVPFVYVQVNKMIYAKKVNAYLLEEEHYTQDEIQSVQGIWGVKLPPFMSSWYSKTSLR